MARTAPEPGAPSQSDSADFAQAQAAGRQGDLGVGGEVGAQVAGGAGEVVAKDAVDDLAEGGVDRPASRCGGGGERGDRGGADQGRVAEQLQGRAAGCATVTAR